MKLNKIALLVKTQINPQKSEEDLYSDALYLFICRLMEGGYHG